MATDILAPKIGFSMDEGRIAEWLALDGDQVRYGQPLFKLESDKSTNEVEATAPGIPRIIARVSETHEVGNLLGYIE